MSLISQDELKKIRQRHGDAAYLANQLPELIALWNDGEQLTDSDILAYFTRSHRDGGFFLDGLTFAMHAHQDMTKLLALVDELTERLNDKEK